MFNLTDLFCRVCRTFKPAISFHRVPENKRGYAGACKACRNIQMREYQQARREHIKKLKERIALGEQVEAAEYEYRVAMRKAPRPPTQIAEMSRPTPSPRRLKQNWPVNEEQAKLFDVIKPGRQDTEVRTKSPITGQLDANSSSNVTRDTSNTSTAPAPAFTDIFKLPTK